MSFKVLAILPAVIRRTLHFFKKKCIKYLYFYIKNKYKLKFLWTCLIN